MTVPFQGAGGARVGIERDVQAAPTVRQAEGAQERQLPEAARLLRTIMQALHQSGVSYALIQGDRTEEEAVASDVDIAFIENPNDVILPVIRRVESTSNARLIQCLHYEVPHGYYYILSAGVPPRFLHLDCLYDPLGINRYRLPTTFLVQGSVAGRWAMRASDDRLALYLLMKRAVKGTASPEALETMRRTFHDASSSVWTDVAATFGAGATSVAVQLLYQAGSTEEIHALLERLRRAAALRFKLTRPAHYVLRLLANLARKARRLLQPTGFFVVVIGPDGAGKSTVAGLVVSQLARAFRKTWRFHWRPGLLPKLRPMKALDELHDGTGATPETSRYRGIVSFARFVYYWLDFILGYWLRILPRKAQTTLIVGERYFPDVLVNPARYGFTVPRWLMRLAACCVPSPDLLVLLVDEPHVIHARKAELSPSALAEQLGAYHRELRHWSPAVTIATKGSGEVVAAHVCGLVLDACARRTDRRLGRG